MINITLHDKQSGYDAIGEYIYRYWNHNRTDIVIVSIETSYDGYHYVRHNELAFPTYFDDIEFLDDWWEGERYINLLGIKAVCELDISGGLYE